MHNADQAVSAMNKHRQLSSNKNKTILFSIYTLFIFAPFFKPFYFNTIPIVNMLYSVLLLNTLLFTSIIFIRKPVLSSHTALFIMYQLILFISSLFNQVPINNFAIDILRNIVLWILVDYYCKRNHLLFLKSLSYLFFSFLLINLLGLLLFPSGLVTNDWGGAIHFLESSNRIGPVLLSMIMITSIYSIVNKGRISFLSGSVFMISIITTIIVWSGSGVSAIIFFLLHLAFVYNKKISKILTLKVYIILIITIFIAFIFAGLQTYFSFFIEVVLNRDLTFSNRDMMWQEATQLIKSSSFENLMIGYGYNVRHFSMWKRSIFTSTSELYLTHAHSEIFEIFLQSGIIGSLIFIKLVLKLIQVIERCDNFKVKSFITGIIFALFLISIFEKTTSLWFYLILVVSFNAPNFRQMEILNKKTSQEAQK